MRFGAICLDLLAVASSFWSGSVVGGGLARASDYPEISRESPKVRAVKVRGILLFPDEIGAVRSSGRQDR